MTRNDAHPLDPETRSFYRCILESLHAAGTPFLVGGAYAFETYTGIERHTKDIDLFVQRHDYDRTMATLAADGCATELTYPHWLGKAFCDSHTIDVIFNSGNGLSPVDADWFNHAVATAVFDVPVKLCPPEEMIWSKSFIMERERYDGADVAHLLRAQAARLNWRRLLERFGAYWHVLLSHLILFGFIYPNASRQIPDWVMDELLQRLHAERAHPSDEPICRGTLLSRAQYLVDVTRWGYRDARLPPIGTMPPEAVAHWTASIGDE